MQKAKVRWAIGGDENSKFFHGIINRKRANLSVKCIMVDGEWVDEPSRVKDEFRIHFATRFQDSGNSRGRLNFNFPNRLNLEQVSDLESPISRDEIRNAVWGCGKNKSPGPDGFTFEFFRCNSSFIALIPKTLDPKVVSDYRPISLIGSLYKVVTKILAMSKWCSWIRGSLNSGKAFVLVNGSPTSEFQFHRGLKQGACTANIRVYTAAATVTFARENVGVTPTSDVAGSSQLETSEGWMTVFSCRTLVDRVAPPGFFSTLRSPAELRGWSLRRSSKASMMLVVERLGDSQTEIFIGGGGGEGGDREILTSSYLILVPLNLKSALNDSQAACVEAGA
ncbi:hypothetical protein Tco_1405418 [Tanacetum coccineum]